jgi:hypothetical protein
MAMNKTAGEKKAGSAKKAAGKGSSAKKAAPKKAGGAAKKAAPKKKAGPKLTDPQRAMLERVHSHTDPAGYRAEKKPENKVLEALLKHKLVKRGKKHESGSYHYLVSNAGQKHLKASAGGTSASTAPKMS